MIIKFSASQFAEAAKAIRNIPGAGQSIDILDHARLSVEKKSMQLTLSDGDIEARATLDCDAEGDILAAIPRPLLDFFALRGDGKEDNGSLEFDADMRQVVARHGKARMTLPILPGKDFPVMSSDDALWSFKLRANELVSMFKLCEKAMGEEETRYYLMGVFLHGVEGELRAAAVNGHQLHAVAVDAPDIVGTIGGSDSPGIIVPKRAVTEIIRMFADDESEVLVSGTGWRLAVEAERLRIVTKLIEGTYPDYERVITPPGEFSFSVAPKDLDNAIARLLVIPKKDGKGKTEAARAVRMTAGPDGLKLEMKGNDGDAEDLIPCAVVGDGDPIAINYKYIRETVAAAGGAKVTFAPSTGAAVRLLTERDDARFVLMQRLY